MVAIKSYEADRQLSHKPAHIGFFLVFGNDSGLIAERVRRILRLCVDDISDPFQLVRLDGDDVAADPLRLADEANTMPMFGGRRAIWLEAGQKNILPALDLLFATPPVDCAIVVEAGSLKKGAPLRERFERAKNAYAVECYPDSPQDLERLIDAEAKSHLEVLVERFASHAAWDARSLEETVRAYAEESGAKLGKVAQPLRAALTGASVSPPVFTVMAVLGRDESLARLRDQAS